MFGVGRSTGMKEGAPVKDWINCEARMTTASLERVAGDFFERLELNQVQRLVLVLAALAGVSLILFPPFCKPSGDVLIFTGFYPIFEWMGNTSPDGVVHFRLLSFMIVEVILVATAMSLATSNSALAAHRTFFMSKRAAIKCPACGMDRHGLEQYCACGYEFEITDTVDDMTPEWVSRAAVTAETPSLPGSVSLDINEEPSRVRRTKRVVPPRPQREPAQQPLEEDDLEAMREEAAVKPAAIGKDEPLLVAPELADYLRRFEEIDLQDLAPYSLEQDADVLPDPAQLSIAISTPTEDDPDQLALEIEAERRERERVEEPLETPPGSAFALADEDRRVLLRVAALRAQKHNRTAEELLRNTLEARIRDHGRKHPVIATYLTHWADIVQERGDVGMAEDMYQRALDILQARLEDNDPQALPPLVGYANLLRKMARDEAAEAFEDLANTIQIALPESIRKRDLTNKLIPMQVWLADGEAIPEEALFEASEAAKLN